VKTKSKKAVIDPLYGAPSERRDTPGHYHKAPTQMTPGEQFPNEGMTGGHGLTGLNFPTEGVSTTVDRMHLSADDEEDGTEIEKDAYGNTISDLTNSSSGSYVGANDWAERMPDLINPNRDTIPVLGRLGDHLGEGHEGALALADSSGLCHVSQSSNDVLELERRAGRSDDDWSFGDVNDLLSREGSVIQEDVLHDFVSSDSHAVGILTITAADVNLSRPETAGWEPALREKFLTILERAMEQDATGIALTNYRAMEVALNNVIDDLERGVYPTNPGGRGAPASASVAAVNKLKGALEGAAQGGQQAYSAFFTDLLYGAVADNLSAAEEVTWRQQVDAELGTQMPQLFAAYRAVHPVAATLEEELAAPIEPHAPIRGAESDERLWLSPGSLVTVTDPSEVQAEFTGSIATVDSQGYVHVEFSQLAGQDEGSGVFWPEQLVQAVTDEPAVGRRYRPVTQEALFEWQRDIAGSEAAVPLPTADDGDIGELSTLLPEKTNIDQPVTSVDTAIDPPEEIADTDISSQYSDAPTYIPPRWMADPQPVTGPLEVLDIPELADDDIDKESALSFEIDDRGPPFGPHNLSVNPHTDQSMGMSSREAAMKTTKDLPAGSWVEVRGIPGSGFLVTYDSLEDVEGPRGSITLSSMPSTTYPDLYEVTLSYADDGWGPLLYDVAIEVASMYGDGLVSDREELSSEALSVWDHYYLSREDIDQRPISLSTLPRKAPLAEEEALQRVYYTDKKTRIDTLDDDQLFWEVGESMKVPVITDLPGEAELV